MATESYKNTNNNNVPNFIRSFNPIFGSIIVVLFCFQNFIYTDLIWESIELSDKFLKYIKPYRTFSLGLSILAALMSWVISTIIFHISALIFSNKEIKITSLFRTSAVCLLIPLVFSFSINIIFFMHNPNINMTSDLNSLFIDPPYSYFKYISWLSYILYLMAMMKSVQVIYNMNWGKSIMTIILPISIIFIIQQIFNIIN